MKLKPTPREYYILEVLGPKTKTFSMHEVSEEEEFCLKDFLDSRRNGRKKKGVCTETVQFRLYKVTGNRRNYEKSVTVSGSSFEKEILQTESWIKSKIF